MNQQDGQVVSIVDDDESLRRSLGNLFSSVGFRVETFATAEAFLESLHRGRPGCLVLDLRMPGMDGFALLGHLSGMDARIPVVILTAHGDLTKPFTSGALLDAVRTALEHGGRRGD